MAQSALKFPPRNGASRVALRCVADRTLQQWHDGLREMKRSAHVSPEDANLVHDVLRNRPQSATTLMAATVAVAKHAPAAHVRRFALGLGMFLQDLSATTRPPLTLMQSWEDETRAQAKADIAQGHALGARTAEDLRAALVATETQIAALETYAACLRAELAPVAS